MKIQTLAIVTLLLTVSTLSAKGASVPNGSFEEGHDTPTGWELSGGEGAWENEGRTGKRCISVTGDGKSSNYWKCESVELRPGVVYRIDFWTKSSPEASIGNVISGTNLCNMDWRHAPQWTSRTIVFRTPDGNAPQYIRLGQWHVRGKVYFDDIRVRTVGPLGARPSGVYLGQGETIRNGLYQLAVPLSRNLNFARNVSFTAGFNSNRWLLNGESEVSFQHNVRPERGGPIHLSDARVEVNVGYYVSGRCVVEVGTNPSTWTPLGEIDGVRSEEFRLPDRFNGLHTIWVRLRGAKKPNEQKSCSLQIHGYRFRATTDRPALNATGATYFVEEIPIAPAATSKAKPPEKFLAKIATVGNPSLGGLNDLKIAVHHASESPIRVVPVMEIDGQRQVGGVREIPPRNWRIDPVALSYNAGRAGEHKATAKILDARTSGTLFAASWEYSVPALYDSGFGYSIESDADCDLWWAEGTYKISRRGSVPNPKKPIEIFAAKGEYEPFQLVVAPKRDLKGLRVKVSPLRSAGDAEMPASAVEVQRVHYVHITRPTDKIGCAGDWPDPLPPLRGPLDLKTTAGCQPLWFTIHVPRDAAAGGYRGIIELTADGWRKSVPFTLHVWDFEIPRENHLKTAFGFSTGNVRRYHNLETEEEQRRVVDLYYRNFAEHRISPYDVAPFDRIKVRFPNTPDVPVRIDFSGFDRAAEKHFGPEYRFTTYRLPLSGMGGGTFHSRHPGRIGKFEQGSPEYEKIFADYLKQLEAHFRERGWLDKAYVYWFDEPNPKDYEFVRDGMERIHRHAPGLRRMLTEQPEKELDGCVDIWCPLTPRVTPEIAKREREKGREVWWYICTGPKGPYCTLFIDHYAIEFRMWSWQTWKTGVQGLLIWQSNYWTSNAAYPPPQIQNPWEDPMSWRSGYDSKAGDRQPWGNGDGRFLYPPNRDPANDKSKHLTGPVNTIRWEQLREGIEDYEYFWLLGDLVAKARKRGVKSDSLAQAQKLLDIPDSITRDHTHFTHDPLHLYRYRARLAEAIVALEKSLK